MIAVVVAGAMEVTARVYPLALQQREGLVSLWWRYYAAAAVAAGRRRKKKKKSTSGGSHAQSHC